jgi:hypothetical protein
VEVEVPVPHRPFRASVEAVVVQRLALGEVEEHSYSALGGEGEATRARLLVQER